MPKPNLDHKALDRILDPRNNNLGNLGAAMVAAAEAKKEGK